MKPVAQVLQHFGSKRKNIKKCEVRPVEFPVYFIGQFEDYRYVVYIESFIVERFCTRSHKSAIKCSYRKPLRIKNFLLALFLHLLPQPVIRFFIVFQQNTVLRQSVTSGKQFVNMLCSGAFIYTEKSLHDVYVRTNHIDCFFVKSALTNVLHLFIFIIACVMEPGHPRSLCRVIPLAASDL